MPSDLSLFAADGRFILSGHWSAVYGGTENQGGPLQNLLATALTLGGSGPTINPLLVALVDAVIMAVALTASRRRRVRARGRDLAVSVFVLLWLWTNGFWGGHPIEALVPICWLVAARLDRDGSHRATVVGLLAVSAAIAPWGVLGWVCLLRLGLLRQFARTVLAAALVTAALYAPFLLAGPNRAATHRWPVATDSGVHLLDPTLVSVGWTYRIAQAALVLAGGALCAWRWQHHPARSALVAGAVCLLRIATDPLAYDYYWVPVAVAATALLAAAAVLRSRAGATLIAFCYLEWVCGSVGVGAIGAIGSLVVLLVLNRGGVQAPMSRVTPRRTPGTRPRSVPNRPPRTLTFPLAPPMDRRDLTDPPSVHLRR